MTHQWLKEEGNYLIYFGDAMCSWCHGFAPELTKITEAHPTIPLHLVMGGLRPFGTEKIADMHDFLKHHWEQVNERSGQPFAFDLLNDPDFVYDTEPASRAAIVVRHLKPEAEFEFFKAIQMAFYAAGKKTDELDTYFELCDEYGIDRAEFQKAFESEEMKEETKQDFQMSQQMGIKGFPSLVMKKGDQYFLLSNGYREGEELVDVVGKVLKEN